MICSSCKNEIEDGVKFCQHCGAPVIFDKPAEEEPAFIAEEPAVIAEDHEVDFFKVNEEKTEGSNEVDNILKDYSSPVATAVAPEKNPESEAPNTEEINEFSTPQNAETVKKSKRVKKLNIPASVAVCVAFGLLMTAFSAVSVAISSVRKTLLRGAVSEQIDDLDVGDIVVGDTDLVDGIVDKGTLSGDATISDVVRIKLEDYEKYIIKGIFEQSSVTVEDIKNIENVDLEQFVGKIDGIDSVDDLDMDALIENFSKLEKDEIDTIVNQYSKEEFPELTFEIDKRRVDDLLNKKQSPAKLYVSELVKAYENYMLTGEDTKPVTEDSLNKLAQESVSYVLDGMNNAYTEEINKEMAQVVSENKAMLNTCNPSAAFGIFGSILPMSLSTVSVFVSLGLAVVFAAVAALITKRVDAAVITLGASLTLAGGAALCANALPGSLAQLTGLDCNLISETASELVKETLVPDFTVMGLRSLFLGIGVIAVVIVAKVIMRAIRNKKGN